MDLMDGINGKNTYMQTLHKLPNLQTLLFPVEQHCIGLYGPTNLILITCSDRHDIKELKNG